MAVPLQCHGSANALPLQCHGSDMEVHGSDMALQWQCHGRAIAVYIYIYIYVYMQYIYIHVKIQTVMFVHHPYQSLLIPVLTPLGGARIMFLQRDMLSIFLFALMNSMPVPQALSHKAQANRYCIEVQVTNQHKDFMRKS